MFNFFISFVYLPLYFRVIHSVKLQHSPSKELSKRDSYLKTKVNYPSNIVLPYFYSSIAIENE
jgi:hypothetical protein